MPRGRKKELTPEGEPVVTRKDGHRHPRVVFHLEQELLDRLDAYCTGHRLRPDRSSVVRLAVEEFLAREAPPGAAGSP